MLLAISVIPSLLPKKLPSAAGQDVHQRTVAFIRIRLVAFGRIKFLVQLEHTVHCGPDQFQPAACGEPLADALVAARDEEVGGADIGKIRRGIVGDERAAERAVYVQYIMTFLSHFLIRLIRAVIRLSRILSTRTLQWMQPATLSA